MAKVRIMATSVALGLGASSWVSAGEMTSVEPSLIGESKAVAQLTCPNMSR